GDGLRQHAAARVEHAGGQIASLAHGGGEGGADQRLRLFLDDREQAVPHDLQMDLVEGGIPGHRDVLPQAAVLRTRTIYSSSLISASKLEERTVVVCSSAISAGPGTRMPGLRSGRQ